MISGTTSVFGIFGHPVKHTFSPEMHNSAFRRIGLDACYVPFSVPPDRLGDAVRAIVPLGLKGVNVTVPHKERVIKHLDELSEDARHIGAVNTIEVLGTRLIGHNTDGRGFLRSLREETSFRPKGKNVLIVGSGGAARAVSFTLALSGVKELLLHDLDSRKAMKLAKELRSRTGVEAKSVDADSLTELGVRAHCLINATPLGLKPNDPVPFSSDLITRDTVVCDLVYNPPDTRLLRTARKKGAQTLRGIGMLLYQGVIAFEIWTGKKAPVQIMRKALERQMAARRK